jgi:hypothetical protein
VHLDELPLEEDLDQMRVGPHPDPLADELGRHRIERPGDLDVVILMDLGVTVDGDVVGVLGDGQQMPELLRLEDLERAPLRGAVDPRAGVVVQPPFGFDLCVGQIQEVFAFEEGLVGVENSNRRAA